MQYDVNHSLKILNTQIQQAENSAGRTPGSVTLLAVSKTKSIEAIQKAIAAGQRSFGENYVQEAVEKIQAINNPNLEWHFIGPIQSNKTKLIAENFAWVHSVDRIKIAERLNKQHGDFMKENSDAQPINICLQLNISEEESKSGINSAELFQLASVVDNCEYLTLRGIMAIPEKNAPESTYLKMQSLFNQLKAQYPSVDTLSLGMSNDLCQAIAAGSTMVRIGTAIFGEREYNQ